MRVNRLGIRPKLKLQAGASGKAQIRTRQTLNSCRWKSAAVFASVSSHGWQFVVALHFLILELFWQNFAM